MKSKYIQSWRNLYNEQITTRVEKMEKMKGAGFDPYAHGVKPTITCQELMNRYAHLAKEEIDSPRDFEITGRILLVRDFGKAAFLQIDDGSHRFQVYVTKNETSSEGFEHYKLSDYGDILWARGSVFKTNKGELTLNALDFKIITKSLRPLPEKFHGLSDQELKYRMRYVDMIMDPHTRGRLQTRSKIVRSIREFFYKEDFQEVETPMMHSVAGGATARPFLTHHNALDIDLFMRIAPELHLKRLVVGGFHKVFEMNRCFRNEGLSLKHNPEFTSIEFYQAYATYEDLMRLTETLLEHLAKVASGDTALTWGERTLDFKGPYRRMKMRDAVMEYASLSSDDLLNKEIMMEKLIKEGKVDIAPKELQKYSLDRLMVLAFETFVEDQLIQPTFITHFPTEVSPLSRRNDADHSVVDRFELYINGWEVANGFNELNDPADQLDRFADQAVLKESGDNEACEPDYDYVRALEYAMPPTAGEGIGIDRLVMLLTDAQSIRDVILFPLLKPETFFEHEVASEVLVDKK